MPAKFSVVSKSSSVLSRWSRTERQDRPTTSGKNQSTYGDGLHIACTRAHTVPVLCCESSTHLHLTDGLQQHDHLILERWKKKNKKITKSNQSIKSNQIKSNQIRREEEDDARTKYRRYQSVDRQWST